MLFLSNNFFPKSQKGNEIWTFLKMSRNWKPKIVLKMGQKCDCDGDDHLYFICVKRENERKKYDCNLPKHKKKKGKHKKYHTT
jgi:hypothetical protein